MIRLLLAIFLLLPAVLLAQDTTTCSQLAIDLDGDLQLGAGDILMLLGGYGTNLDVDGDMIPDCQDDCVGTYDICGVCNGPGPQVLAIDTIIITYDSIYAEAIDEWLIFELDRDTLLHLVCENPGCTDPLADNFDPYANEDGSCTYAGFDCGETWAFDGYGYSTVLIGEQCWFAENLRTTVYSNLDSIPANLSQNDWASTTEGATAIYDNDPFFLTVYGRLYNWYAVNDSRGLCPTGWHVPTDAEWTELEDYITSQGFAGTQGTALKSTTGWSNNGNGTDDFGFSALPSGRRNDSGPYYNLGEEGEWWSSTPNPDDGAELRALTDSEVLIRYYEYLPNGMAVRCLRDAE